MGQWKDFGGVGEGNGPSAGRVEDIEEVDEECDGPKTLALIDEEAHTGREQRPEHIGEGENE